MTLTEAPMTADDKGEAVIRSSDDSFTLVVYDYALDLDLLRQCRYRQ